VIGGLEAGGAAKLAGLQTGDRVLRVDGKAVIDSQQLRDWIKTEPQSGDGAQIWDIDRHGQNLALTVRPQLSRPPGQTEGPTFRRIGAVVGASPEVEWVKSGFVEGLSQGFGRVYQIGDMTLQLIGKMITGNASSKHLSGPLTMAEQAGQLVHLSLHGEQGTGLCEP
jgi:regulator of sigma E protease